MFLEENFIRLTAILLFQQFIPQQTCELVKVRLYVEDFNWLLLILF